MLGALALFQTRLRERDPLDAKRKARLLLGMKQVSRVRTD